MVRGSQIRSGQNVYITDNGCHANSTYDGLEQNVGQDGRDHTAAQLGVPVGGPQHQAAQLAADCLQMPGLRLPGPQRWVQAAPNKRQPGVDQLSLCHDQPLKVGGTCEHALICL